MTPFFVAIAGYLLGSIPFGLLLTRIAGLGDIRAIGSGNIGATNVLRTGRKGLALATLLLDGGKGAAAVLIARLLAPDYAELAGFAAFIGHIFPVWLRFRGGKGVATAAGVLLAASWPVGLIAIVAWIAIAAIFSISSLAALATASLSPFVALFLAPAPMQLLATALAVVVILTHRANIHRLLRGEEPKIGQKKDASPPDGHK